MKLAVSALFLLSLACVGFGQADKIPADEVRFTSVSQTNDGHLLRLHGRVQIETANVIIRADEAVYDTSAKDVKATGDVHITLKN